MTSKLINNFIFSLYLVFSVACTETSSNAIQQINTANMESEIESVLKKKYDEEFKVSNQYFDKGQNVYIFTAHPESNSNIVFEGKYDEREKDHKDRIDNDGFVNTKFSYEAAIEFESMYPNKELKKAISASVYSYYDHNFGSKVPSLDDYLEKRPEKSTIRMNCYYFDIPDHAYHQLVITTQAILELLQEKYENQYSLYVGFWPSGFLEDKKLEDLTFGFESTSMEDADNLINVMQYLSKVLFIKIVNGSIESLDDQRIFDLIKDHNKNGPDEMVEI